MEIILQSPDIDSVAERCTYTYKQFKGELGELHIYFRKIGLPLQQQKFLVVSVLSNSPWLLRNLKKMSKMIL